MIQTRVIPCLLLHNAGLVKTLRFKEPKYLGDPINIVRIFNDKEVDELVFLDITATPERKEPPFELLRKIASECFMPLCYGGGVADIDTMKALYKLGIEKVALNTAAVRSPSIVSAASKEFGAQSVIVSIDVKRKMFGGHQVWTHGGRKASGVDPVEHARRMELEGAGEILLTSIDRDGTMRGYDIELVRRVSGAVGIPVVACGGAASVEDLGRVVREGCASAAAAGSMFVFKGTHRAVLISYPTQGELREAFHQK
jgi:imidazole glycerol-phosphate synthase subunit HisF